MADKDQPEEMEEFEITQVIKTDPVKIIGDGSTGIR